MQQLLHCKRVIPVTAGIPNCCLDTLPSSPVLILIPVQLTHTSEQYEGSKHCTQKVTVAVPNSYSILKMNREFSSVLYLGSNYFIFNSTSLPPSSVHFAAKMTDKLQPTRKQKMLFT